MPATTAFQPARSVSPSAKIPHRLAKSLDIEHEWTPDREATRAAQLTPQRLDRFEAAVLFAMTEASRLKNVDNASAHLVRNRR